MTREEVEKEAREVADKFRDLAKKATLYYISVSDIQVPHRESIGFERGFIAGAVAAAEPCERELERLRAEVAKVTEQRDAWPKYHGMATEGLMVLHDRRDLQDLSGLRCGDFMANAVPHLVAEIDRLRARVAELEGLAEANNRGIPVRHA